MKRILKNSFLLLITLLLITGCKNKDIDIVNTGTGRDNSRSDNPSENINVKGSGTLACVRNANALYGLDGSFNYTVGYRKGIVTQIHSIEKVKGDDQTALDKYEEAYNTIKDRYKGLDHYDISVTRDENSVIFDSLLDYENINMKKFIEISGNQEELYSDNKLELKKWIKFAKKAGTTCKGI